jgi:uncharacterized protein
VIAVNVAQLLKQPTGTTRDFDFSDRPRELVSEVDLVEPIEGHAHLMRTSRGIFVSSQYRTVVRQSCGRCLEPTTLEIEGSSSDEFSPTVDVVTGHTLAEQPESDELAIDERHLLDLTEVIRQDLLTRLPLQPLCREDCPGLCPECGQDLRVARCGCARTEAAASPFAALSELLRGQGPDEPSPEREGG